MSKIEEAQRLDEQLGEDEALEMGFRKFVYEVSENNPTEAGVYESAIVAANIVKQQGEDNEELREEVRRLREENNELRQASELYQNAHKRSAGLRETQAAAVLKAAFKATTQVDKDRVEWDVESIQKILDHDIHRTNTYDVMDKAEDLVGNKKVCWKQKEPRTSSKNTRLIVDVSEYDLPKTIAGIRLNEEVL